MLNEFAEQDTKDIPPRRVEETNLQKWTEGEMP